MPKTTIKGKMRPSQSLAPEESYSERRKLFRNIWETAVTMDDKETKPKVIRTLRLESDDKVRKNAARKKEKLKNLRHVCNKILDFCDKQEAEEFVFEDKVSGEAAAAEECDVKKVRRLRKTKRMRTLYTPVNSTKIKYKHPPPPLAIGDYKHSRRQSPDKSVSSPPKLPSRKDLKSDYQLPTINDLKQNSTVVNRKLKIHKRKKVKKIKK